MLVELCSLCRSRAMSAENCGTIDGLSDPNMSFKLYSHFVCSPVAAVADPWENIVDRDVDASPFFIPATALILVPG